MTRILLALAMVTVLAGCPGTQGGPLSGPDVARVAEVQATYDAEFRAAVAADGVGVRAGRFSRTLAAVSGDRSGLSPAVAGFYSLLEGLVYLQTGQLGQARAIAPEVGASASALNAGGVERRNGVLAENFADLVAVREAEASLRRLTSNSASENAQRVAVVRAIETRSAAVTRRLCRANTGAGDEGTAFVAAYTATSLVQADRALARACLPLATDAELCAGFLNGREQLQDARNLMAAFAGPLERQSGQIAGVTAAIERDLRANQDGAPLGAAVSPCG
ncbi:MAG: hypothetical protein AAGA87_00985 [Pseudomonadota bacterium]